MSRRYHVKRTASYTQDLASPLRYRLEGAAVALLLAAGVLALVGSALAAALAGVPYCG